MPSGPCVHSLHCRTWEWLSPPHSKICWHLSSPSCCPVNSWIMLIVQERGYSPRFATGSSYAAAAAKLLQSCPTLCSPIDGSPPGSVVPGILQARTLEWVCFSFSNAWKWKVKVKLLSRNPMDCSLPGSSVHGIFQARVLERGAIALASLVCP